MGDSVKNLAIDLCPPILRRAAGRVIRASISGPPKPSGPTAQKLDVYWDQAMADMLETWGLDHVWNEIQLLLVNCEGKVLDVACGTGKAMSMLATYSGVELHGCDISDMLIAKAIERGIPRERLTVCDATAMPYGDAQFSHTYSIGSLEHFTEAGIQGFLRETRRVSSGFSFHQVPVSRDGNDHGFIHRQQSYWNNGPEWWKARIRAHYPVVHVIRSGWEDSESVGYWFVCCGEEELSKCLKIS